MLNSSLAIDMASTASVVYFDCLPVHSVLTRDMFVWSRFLNNETICGQKSTPVIAMTTVQNENYDVGGGNFVDSLVILVFAQWIPQQTIEWIVSKIIATRANGGSELEVILVVDQYNQVKHCTWLKYSFRLIFVRVIIYGCSNVM
jgi:hypothetical protein